MSDDETTPHAARTRERVRERIRVVSREREGIDRSGIYEVREDSAPELSTFQFHLVHLEMVKSKIYMNVESK